MRRIPISVGQKFADLTIMREVGGWPRRFECLCKCGEVAVCLLANLRKSKSPTTSCGCRSRKLPAKEEVARLYVEEGLSLRQIARRFGLASDGTQPVSLQLSLAGVAARRPYTKMHGHKGKDAESGEYTSWRGMLNRCLRPSANTFKEYGGRGITVCAEWMDFSTFLHDMGARPTKQHSLERLDNNAGYLPGNVVWALPPQQSRNTRRNRIYTVDGKTQCMTDWAAECGLKVNTLTTRLNRGMGIKDAISAPLVRNGGSR